MRFRLVAALSLLAASLAARAETFAFSFGSPSDLLGGSGTLTGTLIFPDTYQITGISGTTHTPATGGQDVSISRLISPSDGLAPDDDYLVFSGGRYDVTPSGLLYQLPNNEYVELYLDFYGGDRQEATFDLRTAFGNDYTAEPMTFTPLSATPEPSTFALLGTGLFGVASLLKRRLA